MSSDLDSIATREPAGPESASDALCDLLILSDGTVLVHNLTPAMAAVLNEINPEDAAIHRRVPAAGEAISSTKPAPKSSEP